MTAANFDSAWPLVASDTLVLWFFVDSGVAQTLEWLGKSMKDRISTAPNYVQVTN